MRDRILTLLMQAESWRREHKRNRRFAEAAAAEIRIQALYDALGEKRPKPQ